MQQYESKFVAYIQIIFYDVNKALALKQRQDPKISTINTINEHVALKLIIMLMKSYIYIIINSSDDPEMWVSFVTSTRVARLIIMWHRYSVPIYMQKVWIEFAYIRTYSVYNFRKMLGKAS